MSVMKNDQMGRIIFKKSHTCTLITCLPNVDICVRRTAFSGLCCGGDEPYACCRERF